MDARHRRLDASFQLATYVYDMLATWAGIA